MQINTQFTKETMEIGSISLLKENLLLRRNKARPVSPRLFIRINREIISGRLHWLRTLLDRQVSRRCQIVELFRQKETHLKDCWAQLSKSCNVTSKNTKNSFQIDLIKILNISKIIRLLLLLKFSSVSYSNSTFLFLLLIIDYFLILLLFLLLLLNYLK